MVRHTSAPWPAYTTFTSGFVIGVHDGPATSSTQRSARAPTPTYPQSSRPCDSAPVRVAAASACFGEIAVGSHAAPFAESASR